MSSSRSSALPARPVQGMSISLATNHSRSIQVAVGQVALEIDQLVGILLIGTLVEGMKEPAVPLEPTGSHGAQLNPGRLRRGEPGGPSGLGKRQVNVSKPALIVGHEGESEIAGAGLPLRGGFENDHGSVR